MRRRRYQLGLLIAATVLIAAPAAHATTASRDGNTVRIDAAAGEFNAIQTVDVAGTLYVIESNAGNGATLSPGPGCAAATAVAVTCGMTATATEIIANLGDLSDLYLTGVVPAALTLDGGGDDDIAFGPGVVTTVVASSTMSGGSGNDILVGGRSTDVLSGGPGGDTIQDVAGDNTLDGGDGPDVLIATTGTNTMSGGPDADLLQGGSGNDEILGGDDNDQMAFFGRVDGADVVNGGAGNDSVGLYAAGDPLNISLDGVANDGVADQGANVLGVEYVSGGGAGDTLTGSAAAEQLNGAGGADTIDGGGGNDSLSGGSENDTLVGGDGNDSLVGNSGDDSLSGGAGTDMVYGQRGADDMSGGDGRDTVNFGNGEAYEGATVTLDDVGNDGAEGEGDNARSDNENILGTGGPDVLFGTAGANTIDGGEGDDVIVTEDGGPGAAVRDNALCGSGEDLVRADPLDFIGEMEELCESVQYGSLAGWGPDLAMTAFGRGVGDTGVLPLELGCPFRAREGCEGTVELLVGGRRAGRVRFSIAAGDVADRELRLNRRVRRTLARGRRVRGTLRSTVADEIGATKTATKSVTLTP